VKPLQIAPVDRSAQLAASALGQHLRSERVRIAAAASWARALEVSVAVSDAGVVDAPAVVGLHASAGLVLVDGRRACLTVSTQVLAGLMGALAGATPRAVGPTPLSPAEEGLFAFLVLRWTALLPQPPALDWVDGGAGLTVPPDTSRCVAWHLKVADQTGLARWRLPADLPPPRVDITARPRLPVDGILSAGRARWAGASSGGTLSAGDLVVLATPPRLQVGDHAWPIQRRAHQWRVVSTSEVRMPLPIDELPVTLDAVVGRITLTVGDVAALAPGVVLPIAPDALPLVTLMAGGQPVARGVLVDDDGHAAVQITQLIDAPS
jgi:flagellar motor switch protein FliN/FliY